MKKVKKKKAVKKKKKVKDGKKRKNKKKDNNKKNNKNKKKKEDIREKKEEIDPVSARIEKLEKWIQKIAVAGPGSGEVRILNMDDVDTTDLANNKYLKYNSSTGKFVFATVSGGGSGGHTMQNACLLYTSPSPRDRG